MILNIKKHFKPILFYDITWTVKLKLRALQYLLRVNIKILTSAYFHFDLSSGASTMNVNKLLYCSIWFSIHLCEMLLTKKIHVTTLMTSYSLGSLLKCPCDHSAPRSEFLPRVLDETRSLTSSGLSPKTPQTLYASTGRCT